jgi:hypothetical protein
MNLQYHFPSLLSAIIFVLRALLLFGIGLLMGFAVLVALYRDKSPGRADDPPHSFWF